MGLVLANGTLLTQDARRRVVRGSVRVEGQRIAAVGDVPRERGDEVLDCSGAIVLPGLVNAHTHAPMTLLRGYGDDLALEEWLRTRIWPVEARLTAATARAGADLAMLEMVTSGTTSFMDMYFFEEEVARAAANAGVRAGAGFAFVDFGTPELPKERQLAECEGFVKRWLGHSLVTPVVAPHAAYTCGPETLEACGALAAEHQVPLTVHCSETRSEVYQVQEQRGARPLELLARHGCLGPRTVLAHCGWITKEEVRRIAAAKAKVAHCPVSNLKLGTGGFTPLPELLAAGAGVGLGTDGPASNNTLDMFETMKFAALVHKHHRWDPTVLPAQAALDLATLGGAACLGRDDLGSLEPGKLADIVVLDARGPRMQPLHDPVSQVVYAARGSDVESVVIDGKLVLREGRAVTLDAEAVVRRAAEAARQLTSGA